MSVSAAGPRHRWLALGIWLLLLLAGAGVIARSHFSADLSAFLPASPDAKQRMLIEQDRVTWTAGLRYGRTLGFHEPFFAYGKSEAPFFVTRSGKVFQLQRPEKKEPKVVKVWDDSKRLVSTILNDADTNRTFVAGPDPAEGPGHWFYFELTDNPEKKPFDRSAMETIKAEEPLQSSLVFARFLVKEGLIKDKPR